MIASALLRRFPFFLAILLAITAASAGPASAQVVESSSRITQAVDESFLVTLACDTHPLAQSRFDQGPAFTSMPASRMLLVLTRSTQQEADLQTYPQSVQNANSPVYRKLIGPDEFGARSGVGEADLHTIQTWLTSHGFTVNKVSRGRTAIEFSGTVGQLQSTFHTSIHSYRIDGIQHWANATDPQIPAALAPVVAGVAPLNSFRPKAHFYSRPQRILQCERAHHHS